ncbi:MULTISPECIES: hypothetical protein [Nostoc]|uniref:Uncharacterized protein n=2 Tax=Nostoc TaxID=1177 RepID=A0ABR8I4L2_9NOSO|nr:MULTISPECIES: hypothetical protein [Nostoc]MBD2560181.1 hypothetical protein [Nostoc linckia FACHB-391]MBD2645837.1 hypothetical protein [Nostoc foliaceum FACHB-393]
MVIFPGIVSGKYMTWMKVKHHQICSNTYLIRLEDLTNRQGRGSALQKFPTLDYSLTVPLSVIATAVRQVIL